MRKIQWTKRDDLASRREGWLLSDCDYEGQPVVQLQKVDSPSEHDDLDYDEPVFDSDEDAWLFVVLNPSRLHIKAGLFLAQECPSEHWIICNYIYTGEFIK